MAAKIGPYAKLVAAKIRPTKGSCTRSVQKAEKEYEEAKKTGCGLDKFVLDRLPKKKPVFLPILPMFDLVGGDEPEVYYEIEKIFFGDNSTVLDDATVTVVKKLVEERKFAEGIRHIRRRVSAPDYSDRKVLVNDNTLLDYASRKGMSKAQAQALIAKNSFERIKSKNIVVEDGRIVDIEM